MGVLWLNGYTDRLKMRRFFSENRRMTRDFLTWKWNIGVECFKEKIVQSFKNVVLLKLTCQNCQSQLKFMAEKRLFSS